MRTTTPRAAVIATVLAAIATAGCTVTLSAGSSTPSRTTDSAAPATTPGQTTTPDATEPTSTSPAALTAIDFGEPGASTEPGTVLTRGEPGWFTQTRTIDGEEISGTIGVTLVDIRELDPEIYEVTNDPGAFSGYTPYAVVIQYSWYFDLPAGADHQLPQGLYPLFDDGSSAPFISEGTAGTTPLLGACGLDLPEYDAVNQTLVGCIVGLSQDAPVTGLKWVGEDYGYTEITPGNPYVEAPVRWR